METTVFKADKISVEGGFPGCALTVTVEGDPKKIVEDMSIEDRLHDLEPHEIVNHIGAGKLLETMDEAEIAAWLSNGDVDPTEFLSAIGEEEVLRWLNNE